MSTVADPIVPIVPFDELSPAFQARSRQAEQRLGARINSVHACAHAEELGGAARDFLSSSMTLGSLPRELRLLIRLAVANVNQCRYCTAHQRHQLVELGVPAVNWPLSASPTATPSARANVPLCASPRR
jgi:AhpD family alkylhydroperoxidase